MRTKAGALPWDDFRRDFTSFFRRKLFKKSFPWLRGWEEWQARENLIMENVLKVIFYLQHDVSWWSHSARSFCLVQFNFLPFIYTSLLTWTFLVTTEDFFATYNYSSFTVLLPPQPREMSDGEHIRINIWWSTRRSRCVNFPPALF